MGAPLLRPLISTLALAFASPALADDQAAMGEPRPVAVKPEAEDEAPAPPDPAPLPPAATRLIAADSLPGTFGDPLRGVLLLPGVTHLASGVAQPLVRGLQPATAQLRLDGVPVPMMFHLLAVSSTIHPAFLGELDFYPGATPVEHGRHLGAALEASGPRATRTDRLELSADLLNAGAFWQLPLTSTGTEIAVAGRAGWTPLLGSLIANAVRSGVSHTGELFDYQALIRQRVGSGSLRLLAFGSVSRVGQVVQDRGDTLLPYDGFHRVDLRANAPVGPASVEAGVTWGMEELGIDVGGGDVFGLEARDQVFSSRVEVAVPLGAAVSVRIGGDLERRDPMTVQRSVFDAPEVPGEPEAGGVVSIARQQLGPALFAGAYAAAEVTLGDTWIEPAVRFDRYGIFGLQPLFAFEPRLQARHRLSSATTLGAAFGVHHQLPTTLIPLPVIAFARAPMGLQELYQGELNVDQTFGRFSGRATAYLQRLGRSIELSPFDPSFQRHISWDPALMAEVLADRVENGYGFGVELMVRGEVLPNLSGFVSYAFQKSLRNTRFTRFDAAGEPTGAPLRALLAAPLEREHVLNLVGTWQLPSGWSVGANLHFNSGFPEAGNVASHTQVESEDGTAWLPVDRDQVGRMPLYWRVDARVAKRWNVAAGSIEAYLDVMNLTVNQETLRFNYNRSSGDEGVTLSRGELRFPVILPMLGVRAEL